MSKQLKELSIDELFEVMCKDPGSSLASVAQTMKEQDIDGSVLADSIDELDSLFADLGIQKIGPKRALKKFIQNYQPLHQIPENEAIEMETNTANAPVVDPNEEFSTPPEVPVRFLLPELEKKLPGAVPLVTRSSRTGVIVKAIATNHTDPNNMQIYLVVDPTLVPIENLTIDAFGPTTVEISGGPLTSSFVYQCNLTPPDTYLPAKVFKFFDSTNSSPVNSSGSVKFIDTKSGNEVKTCQVSNGRLNLSDLSLPNAIYNLECSFGGYTTATFPNIFFNDMWAEETERSLFLDSESRTSSPYDLITLRWDQHPRDLDLHVVSNRGDHVYYSNKKSGNFELDVDVTKGYGPETLTITPAQHNYLVYVHLYSGNGELYTSNARLTLRLRSATGYCPELAVPRSPIPGHPRYWKAFAIIGGRFVNYNKVQTEEPHL